MRGATRSEHSVGEGMQEDIAVGMAAEALGVGQRNSTDFQGNAGLELVGVPAEADAGGWFHFGQVSGVRSPVSGLPPQFLIVLFLTFAELFLICLDRTPLIPCRLASLFLCCWEG